MTKPKRWVYAFVADIRHIPKTVDFRHKKLMASGVSITLFDMVKDFKVAKRYGVTTAPYYLIMQLDHGGTPRIYAETRSLSDIEEWVGWDRDIR